MLRMSFYRILLTCTCCRAATTIYSIHTTNKSLCDNDFMWQESVQQEDAHVVTERGRSEKPADEALHRATAFVRMVTVIHVGKEHG